MRGVVTAFFVFSIVLERDERLRPVATALADPAFRWATGRVVGAFGASLRMFWFIVPSPRPSPQLAPIPLGFGAFFAFDTNLPLAFGQQMLLFSRASFEKSPETACFRTSTM